MIRYRVIAIPENVADKVRASLRSPQYGHPAHLELATGFGPCRLCLRTFQEGREERVLFTYNSFSGTGLIPLPGPIFIHQRSCPRHHEPEFPSDLNTLDLILEGYSADGKVTAFENPVTGKTEEAVSRILSDESVRFIQIRNAKAGCYVARIERILDAA